MGRSNVASNAAFVAQIPSGGPYSDPSCTEPLAQAGCDGRVSYFVDASTDSCGAALLHAAFAVEPYQGPTYLYFTGGEGCKAAPNGPYPLYKPGATLDLSTLPVITETTDP